MAMRFVVASFAAMATFLRAATSDVEEQEACQTYVEESATHGCAAQFAAEVRDAVRRGGEHEAVVEACRSTCRKDAEDALLGWMAMDCERHVPWNTSEKEVRMRVETRARARGGGIARRTSKLPFQARARSPRTSPLVEGGS